MKTMKRLLALCLSAAVSLTLFTGCSKENGSSSAGEAKPIDVTTVSDPYLATAGVAGDTVVGKVGDFDITADSLLYWLNYNISYTLQQYSALGMTELPWDTEVEGVTMEQSVLDTALQLAAYYRLVPEIAAKEGVSIPQTLRDEFNAAVQNMKDELNGDENLFKYYFWMQMMTPEMYDKIFESGELNGLLAEHFFGEGTADYPTDADVFTYLEQQGRYRVKHILLATKDLETGDDLPEATVKAQKEKAEGLLAQLRASNDAVNLFDKLMNANSEDPGLKTNPDGYEAYKGQMMAEFETASLALKNGEISDIVETEAGYHIILRLPMDPDKYREELMGSLMEQKSSTWLEEYKVEPTKALSKIDPSDFYAKAESLQMGAYTVLGAALMGTGADDSGSSSASSSAEAQG